MINRLISNLPFRPSLMEDLSFYSQRLRREQSVRRLGFIMIILSLVVQLFAANVPAEKSLAASNNDVIKGGADNLGQLRNKYNSQADVRGLYQHFGLESADLQNGGAQHITFGFQYQGDRGVRTVGRQNFSYTKDQSLGVFAGTEFFSRSASEWQGSTAAFAFGQQQGADGKYYQVWVLKDCGNIAYLPVQSFETGLSPNKPVEQTGLSPNHPVASPPSSIPTTPSLPVTTASIPTTTPPKDLTLQKFALNITQNLNAKQTTEINAKPGDLIEYTLLTKTKYNTTVKNYTAEDYVGDLLDYSDLDMASISSQGGKYSAATKKITWEKQDVLAGDGLRKTFKTVIKKNIPRTNSPNATAPEFDCRMQNGYGNEVIVKVECPLIKQVETLPNTGPGTTVAIGFAVMVLSGYFLARNGLMGKELTILKKRYVTSGGKG